MIRLPDEIIMVSKIGRYHIHFLSLPVCRIIISKKLGHIRLAALVCDCDSTYFRSAV